MNLTAVDQTTESDLLIPIDEWFKGRTTVLFCTPVRGASTLHISATMGRGTQERLNMNLDASNAYRLATSHKSGYGKSPCISNKY